jgi:hypothetical protein
MEETEDEKVFFGYYRSLFRPLDNAYDFLTGDDIKEYKCYDDGDADYQLE